jgi:hypothetical protein
LGEKMLKLVIFHKIAAHTFVGAALKKPAP